MAVLGIEGTAHTLGVGIVEANEDAPRCKVLANERAMVKPPEPKPGEAALGIHPRESAEHHSERGPGLVRAALDAAGLDASELEGIAFSQGPGLGPCLRVAATMARALAVRHDLPLIGVNHCVSHLEIGRGTSNLDDPVLMYASGANTQVIAFTRGKYRVFGETLDTGIGNALDKFAREHGVPFPGGPVIETEAATVSHRDDAYHPLPYTVKGMDLAFSGVATAATRLVHDGVPFAEACHSFQETAFAALVEVTERALAHTGKSEVILGGGVACNSRLQTMARTMAEDRGAAYHCPPRPLLVDNGAMIAWNGLLRLEAGHHTPLDASGVMPYQRTDQVDVDWTKPTDRPPAATEGFIRGAEAHIEPMAWLGRDAIAKRRVPKTYRLPAVDAALNDARTRDEGNLLMAARRAGVRVPVVYDVDRRGAVVSMQRIDGTPLRDCLADMTDGEARATMHDWGAALARLHGAGLCHGDPTTSNVLLPGDGLVFIDFGLGQFSEDIEPRGVDLHLVEEALEATEPRADILVSAFLEGYQEAGGAQVVLDRLDVIRERGRYRNH